MYKTVDEFELKKTELARDIIGEIAMAEEPNKTIRKWRSLFKVSQKALSRSLGVTSSVISDYESGRRKSPGILFLKKYVEALMAIDVEHGGEVLKSFISVGESKPASSAIADIKEFESGMDIADFCSQIGAVPVTKPCSKDEKLFGYTVIDSVKAITELSGQELVKLYGVTTQRALIFTNVTTGKGPMIAIKIANLRPALVVLHQIPPRDVSDIAKNIAVVEGISLAICERLSLENLLEKLKKIG